MPVEEFVAGWISGETFFFLPHITPSGRSLPGDIEGAETKVLVALEHPEPAFQSLLAVA